MSFEEYIQINQEVRFGKPTIIGTRISVSDVLNWLAAGQSFEEILLDFPELNVNQLKACCAYAANKDENVRVA